jgi:hypothetical protein
VPEQDFFQMGGDSLKAIRFVSELEHGEGSGYAGMQVTT